MSYFNKRFNRFNSKIIVAIGTIVIVLLIVVNLLFLPTNSKVVILERNDTICYQNNQIRKFRCLIEGYRKLPCLLDGNNEIYMPFGFIKKQFDVTGKLNKGNFLYCNFINIDSGPRKFDVFFEQKNVLIFF